MFDRHEHVTHGQLVELLEPITERITAMEASQAQNQASIDAETVKVNANEAKLVLVQQEVDALKLAQSTGQALDFTAIDAALAGESTQADVDVADAAPAVATPPAPPA